MPQKPLYTSRISLLPLEPDDKDALYELDVHPEVMRYIYTGKPLTEEEASMSFDHLLGISKTDEGLGCWVGRDEEKNFIGWWVVATPLPPEVQEQSADALQTSAGQGQSATSKHDNRRVEVGMRIAPRYWGQGFAKEGLQALLQHCFTDLNKSQVYGETMSINTGCRVLMEKCGMQHVRTWHTIYDQFTPAPGIEEGEVEHCITREQWLSKVRAMTPAE